MAKKTVRDVDLKGKRVLCRVDFNVPIKGGKIGDDTRIRESLPTLRYILEQPGSRLILMSHLGRPKDKPEPEYSLKPVAQRLAELLGRPVAMAADCVGEAVEAQAKAPGRGRGPASGERALPQGGDRELPRVRRQARQPGGHLRQRRLRLGPPRPRLDGRGGSPPAGRGRVSDGEGDQVPRGQCSKTPGSPSWRSSAGPRCPRRSPCWNRCCPGSDSLIIGGGMAYTFLKAQGVEVGKSLVEDELPGHRQLAAEEGREAEGEDPPAAGPPGRRPSSTSRPRPSTWPERRSPRSASAWTSATRRWPATAR